MDSIQSTNGLYFPLKESSEISIERTHIIVQKILNHLFKKDFSIKKWKKLGRFECTIQSTEYYKFSFEEICEHIIKYHKFDREKFNFPKIYCYWLDENMSVFTNFYVPNETNDESRAFIFKTSLGEGFPISPKIDREGGAFATMQFTLQEELLRSRKYLVDYSSSMLETSGIWLSTLITYFNTCISIVEITLIQLYYKAKYDSKAMNWSFCEDIVGSTVCRRMEDKFKWIGQITGKYLDDASKEMESFSILKSVRNHLNHFDPPVFAYTIEDVSVWLSMASDIGNLLIKIREKMNIIITDQIVEIALLPKVEFIPHDIKQKRYPQKDDVGYRSSIFK